MYNSIWYQNLIKPQLTPPAFIFGPVWGAIYTLIFISFLIFFLKTKENKGNLGYIFFWTQLLLNLLWSPAFFYFQNICLSLIIIIFLDIFTLLVIVEFNKVSKIAGMLLIPYMLWLLYATYLNLGFFILN